MSCVFVSRMSMCTMSIDIMWLTDGRIRVYDTSYGAFNEMNDIQAQNHGVWSIPEDVAPR